MTATSEALSSYPKSIERVTVDGAMVIEDGYHAGKIAGRVLRRN